MPGIKAFQNPVISEEIVTSALYFDSLGISVDISNRHQKNINRTQKTSKLLEREKGMRKNLKSI